VEGRDSRGLARKGRARENRRVMDPEDIENTHLDHDRSDSSREWNARAYHALSEPQYEWGRRVLNTLGLAGSERALDAGCGSGRLTALLANRLPGGSVVAFDRSENMVRAARETLAAQASRCTVAVGDLLALPFSNVFDVVFSTATFHWILDHDALFAAMYSALKPGGVLHAQCGGKHNLERAHERAEAVMATRQFMPYFRGWTPPWEFADAATTAVRLERAGFTDVRTSVEQAYVELPDARTFRAFVSVVVLRPHLSRIPTEELREQFVDDVTKLAAKEEPAFLLDYWRLNITATKPGGVRSAHA
jgi:trans-aconitate 2-methyltransferase